MIAEMIGGGGGMTSIDKQIIAVHVFVGAKRSEDERAPPLRGHARLHTQFLILKCQSDKRVVKGGEESWEGALPLFLG